ncbi:MAG: response regulator transcription factor [Hydrococcus sp. Prado102]|jgi:DNA-binding response OmpR family regulator|nr:response regulator transcription factor [Hydrococcus sp. Prado102]
MRFLLIEDDAILAESLAESLVDQRYAVDIVGDGEVAWQQIIAIDYDLVLLDIMLPKIDGITLCKQLRDRGFFKPILMLTGCDTNTDKILGLDAGADDYIIKPFDLLELFARIRALLRRGEACLPPILTWGSLRLDPSTFEVTFAGKPLQLTPKEYSILELLMRYGRRVISRSVIIEHIWSLKEPPTEETVKTHIKSLRHKLNTTGAPKDAIETVRGIGYRLKPFF